MDKDKKLDWKQFEEALARGSSVDELLGLTDPAQQRNVSQSSNTSGQSASQKIHFYQNLTVDMPDSLLPLKFVCPITNCSPVSPENITQSDTKSEQLPQEASSMISSWPTLPLECVLPECSSPNLDKLLKEELGIKMTLDINKK